MQQICYLTSKYALNFDLMKNLSPNLFIGNFKASICGCICTLTLLMASIITIIIFMSHEFKTITNFSVVEVRRDKSTLQLENNFQFALLVMLKSKYLNLSEINDLFSVSAEYLELAHPANSNMGWNEIVLSKEEVSVKICEIQQLESLRQLDEQGESMDRLSEYLLCPQYSDQLIAKLQSSHMLNSKTKVNLLRINISRCEYCTPLPVETLQDYQLQLMFREVDVKYSHQMEYNLESHLTLWKQDFRNTKKGDILVDQVSIQTQNLNILQKNTVGKVHSGVRIRQSHQISTILDENDDNNSLDKLYVTQDILSSGKEIQYNQVNLSIPALVLQTISKVGGLLIVAFFICSCCYGAYAKHYLIQEIINRNYEMHIKASSQDRSHSRGTYNQPFMKDVSQLDLQIKGIGFRTNNNQITKVDTHFSYGYFSFLFLLIKNTIIGLFLQRQQQISSFQYFLMAKQQVVSELNLSQIISSYYDTVKMKQILFSSEQSDIFDNQLKIHLKDTKRNNNDSDAIHIDSLNADMRKFGPFYSSLENHNQQQFSQKSTHYEQRLAEWKELFLQFINSKLREEINKNNSQQFNQSNKFSKDISLVNLIQNDSEKKSIKSGDTSPIKLATRPSKRDYTKPRRSLKDSPSNFLSKNCFSSTIFFMNSKTPQNQQNQQDPYEKREYSPSSFLKRRIQQSQQLDLQAILNQNSPKDINQQQQIQQQSINSFNPQQLQIKLNISDKDFLKPTLEQLNNKGTGQLDQQSSEIQGNNSQKQNAENCNQIQYEDLSLKDSSDNSQEKKYARQIKFEEFQQEQKCPERKMSELKQMNQNNMNVSVDRESSTSNVLVDFTTYQQFIINDMVKQQELKSDQDYIKKRSSSFDMHFTSPTNKIQPYKNYIQDDQQVDLIISLNSISPQGKFMKKQTSPHRSSDENFHCDRRTVDSNNIQITDFNESKRYNSPSKLDLKLCQESKKEISQIFNSYQNCSYQEFIEKTKSNTIQKQQQNQYFIQSLTDIQENIFSDNIEETNKDKVSFKDQFRKSYVFSPSLRLKNQSKTDRYYDRESHED